MAVPPLSSEHAMTPRLGSSENLHTPRFPFPQRRSFPKGPSLKSAAAPSQSLLLSLRISLGFEISTSQNCSQRLSEEKQTNKQLCIIKNRKKNPTQKGQNPSRKTQICPCWGRIRYSSANCRRARAHMHSSVYKNKKYLNQ